MVESWERIEQVLREAAPRTLATLGPPATSEQLKGLEGVLGLKLPRSLVQSLERHDGQRDDTRLLDFSGAGILLSTVEIAELWRMGEGISNELRVAPVQVDPRLKSYPWRMDQEIPEEEEGPWWKSTLVPFAADEGDLLCIDTDETLGSGVGEIVWHVPNSRITRGTATNYVAWLAEVVRRLEAGGLTIDEHGFTRLEPRF